MSEFHSIGWLMGGPISVILLMLAIVRWLGLDWDTVTAMITVSILCVLWGLSYFLDVLIAALRNSFGGDLPFTPQPPRSIPNMNEDRHNSDKMEYTVQRVEIHKPRLFCRALLDMREHGKVELKEQKWIAFFGGRNKYVHVRDVVLSGAFAKIYPRDNSPFDVVNWGVVERMAGR